MGPPLQTSQRLQASPSQPRGLEIMAPKRVKKTKVGHARAAALHSCRLPPTQQLAWAVASLQRPTRHAHTAAWPACTILVPISHTDMALPALLPRPIVPQAKASSQTFYYPFMAAPIPISLTEEDVMLDMHIMQASPGVPRVCMFLQPGGIGAGRSEGYPGSASSPPRCSSLPARTGHEQCLLHLPPAEPAGGAARRGEAC